MKVPFKIDLKGRVAVVTGGGGVLCSTFASALAQCGARVAILDLKEEAAEAVAENIRADGGEAMAVQADVLSRESLEKARDRIEEALGACDILVNGAGGNHPRGTTSGEYLREEDLVNDDKEMKTFFDLDSKGVSFVFNLNFM